MEAQPREIQRYVTADGRVPFAEWLDSLRDTKAQYRIDLRLNQVQLGNLGDYHSVGEGVWELISNYGPGYRIYFGQISTTIVLLLCGEDKGTADRDILKAIEYWTQYKSMPIGDSYQDYLISRLKKTSYAAGYIETFFEETDPEPELLRLVLSNVAKALAEQNMTSEEAKLHIEELDGLLSQRGIEVIYRLRNWLNVLGLKLTATVCEEAKDKKNYKFYW
jgi:putative addiction module killer protein